MNIRILKNKTGTQDVQAEEFDITKVKPDTIESSILEGVSSEEEYDDDFGFDDR